MEHGVNITELQLCVWLFLFFSPPLAPEAVPVHGADEKLKKPAMLEE